MTIHEALEGLDMNDPAQARVAAYVVAAHQAFEDLEWLFTHNAEYLERLTEDSGSDAMAVIYAGKAATYRLNAGIMQNRSESLDGATEVH